MTWLPSNIHLTLENISDMTCVQISMYTPEKKTDNKEKDTGCVTCCS